MISCGLGCDREAVAAQSEKKLTHTCDQEYSPPLIPPGHDEGSPSPVRVLPGSRILIDITGAGILIDITWAGLIDGFKIR